MDNIDKKIKELMSRFHSGDPVYSKNTIIEEICLFFSRWTYRLTKGVYFDVKFFIQRLVRGYTDLDKWNAAWYISRKAIPVLTAWRNSEIHGTSIKRHYEDRFGNIIELPDYKIYDNNGIPHSFTIEEWRDIIDDIIFAFKFVADSDNNEEFSEESYREEYKRYKKGMKLLGIYFFSLWD